MANLQRSRIVVAARSYINTPFLHAGRSKLGLDCVGLLIKVGHDLDMFDWDDTDYGPTVDPERLRREIEMFCDPVDDDTPILPGDVLLFAFAGDTMHVGMITDTNSEIPIFIHAYKTIGYVVEERLDHPWDRRLVQRFVWKGL